MSSPLQKGQPLEDKIILVLFLISTLAAVVFIRWMSSPSPPRPSATALSALGLALFVAGQALISLTFRANTFAAPVVKHQAERAQKVIDAGPYRFVRHPMYAGAALLFIGLPLWLESFAATLAALVPIGLLAFASSSFSAAPSRLSRLYLTRPLAADAGPLVSRFVGGQGSALSQGTTTLIQVLRLRPHRGSPFQERPAFCLMRRSPSPQRRLISSAGFSRPKIPPGDEPGGLGRGIARAPIPEESELVKPMRSGPSIPAAAK